MSQTETFEKVLRAAWKQQQENATGRGVKLESVYGTPFGDFRMYWDETGFRMDARPSQMPYWESDEFAPKQADAPPT